jgi:hypothetical protein
MPLASGIISAKMHSLGVSRMFKNNGIYMPDEITVMSAAIDEASVECNLTGSHGRQRLARALLQRYQPGTSRRELVELAKLIVWRQRGLREKPLARRPKA